MKNKKLMLSVGIVSIEIILAIISYLILPDTLIMQITTSGEAGNVMPKSIGLAVPLLISIIFSILYYIHDNKKHFFVAAVGIVISILILVFNI